MSSCFRRSHSTYDRLAGRVARAAEGRPYEHDHRRRGRRAADGRREQYRATQPGEFRLGGIGESVAHELDHRLNRPRLVKEIRTCVLGHLQRGGDPTTLDRILGTSFGVKAVDLIVGEKFGQMVSYQNSQVHSVPIASAVRRQKLVQPDSQIVATCRAIGISFGD